MSYIVAVTRTTNGIPHSLEDQWSYHESFTTAKAQYDSMLKHPDTWSVSLTMVLESSDYPTHEEIKNAANS